MMVEQIFTFRIGYQFYAYLSCSLSSPASPNWAFGESVLGRFYCRLLLSWIFMCLSKLSVRRNILSHSLQVWVISSTLCLCWCLSRLSRLENVCWHVWHTCCLCLTWTLAKCCCKWCFNLYPLGHKEHMNAIFTGARVLPGYCSDITTIPLDENGSIN